MSIAAKVGVDTSAVNRWISGAKKPGPTSRARILEHYGIDSALWDQHPEKSAPPPPRKEKSIHPPAAAPATDAIVAGGAFAMANALQRDIEDQLQSLIAEGKGWVPAERAQTSQRLAAAINVLAKLTGQYDLERRFWELPMWRAVERELTAVLTAHPAAAKAVRERFGELRARRSS